MRSDSGGEWSFDLISGATPFRPISEERKEGDKIEVHLSVADQHQLDEWISHARRKRGFKKIDRGQLRHVITKEAAGFSLDIGESMFQRGIGKVALEFLSLAMPSIARADELASARKAIRHGDGALDVFWDADPEEVDAPSPFRAGHRIVVGAGADSVICARVLLFGAIPLATVLGRVPSVKPWARIFHIDPTAEAPNDLVTQHVDHALPTPRRHADGLALFRERLPTLWQTVSARRWEVIADELRKRLTKRQDVPEYELHDVVQEFFSEHPNLTIDLVFRIVKDLAECFEGASTTAQFGAFVRETFFPQHDQGWEVSRLARVTASLVATIAGDRIVTAWRAGEFSVDFVRSLVAGGEGQQIVASVIVPPLRAAIERTT